MAMVSGFGFILVAGAALLLAGLPAVTADQLEKGDLELQFRFSYNNLDFDGPGGSSEFKEALAFFGYMLTDHHEIGAGVAYSGSGSSDGVEFGAFTPGSRTALDGMVDGIQQILVVHRLLEEIRGPPFHRLDTCRYVAVTCEEDDGHVESRRCHLLMELQTGPAGHVDVQHHAGGIVRG